MYQTKKSRSVNHGLVVKPLRSDLYNSRVQLDLIDMQSFPCKYNGKTYLTKFIYLRQLEAASAFCVAYDLYLILCEFGLPVILQSNNRTDLRNELFSIVESNVSRAQHRAWSSSAPTNSRQC